MKCVSNLFSIEIVVGILIGYLEDYKLRTCTPDDQDMVISSGEPYLDHDDLCTC